MPGMFVRRRSSGVGRGGGNLAMKVGAVAPDAAAGGGGVGAVVSTTPANSLPLSPPPPPPSLSSSPPPPPVATAAPSMAPVISSGPVEAAADEPAAAVAAAAAPAAASRRPYDWARQWYPLGLVRDLPTDAPTAVTVLEQRLVVWHAGGGAPAAGGTARSTSLLAGGPASTHDVQVDSGGGWRAFYDRCPHRFAALSEGRLDISTGVPRLQCVYHGWTFGGSGECTRIPQAPAGEAGSPGLGAPGPAACATPLPTTVVGGILFGWLGGSVGAPPSAVAATAAEAAAAPPPAAVADGRGAVILSSYTRELPIAFTSLLENVVDPAHIVWAHHGLLGHRDDAGPVDVRMLSGGGGADGAAAVDGGGAVGDRDCGDRGRGNGDGGWVADHAGGRVRVEWRPPCLVDIRTAAGYAFSYYAVPVSPGVVRTVAVKACAPGVGGPRAAAAAALVPRWVDHLRRHQLLEGDLLLMVAQEAATRAAEAEGGWRRFYLPTPADRCVVALRRWIDEYGTPWEAPREPGAPSVGNSAPTPAPLSPALSLYDRRALLDRTPHLATCASCRVAVDRLVTARAALRALSMVAAAVGGAAALAAGGGGAVAGSDEAAASAVAAVAAVAPAVGGVAVLTAVAATVAAAAAERLLGHFEFVDYRHAHIP